MAEAGLQQSIATREPNLEPRRDTMCLLGAVSEFLKSKRSWRHIPDVDSNLLALMMVGVHEDPLNQVIAVLITRDWDS